MSQTPENPTPDSPPPPAPGRKRSTAIFIALLVVSAVAAVAIVALLVSIFQHKQEQRIPFVRRVDVDNETSDPVPWGKNWPSEYDSYSRTVEITFTRFGGSEGSPAPSRLQKDPWLTRMFAGYAFAIDFRQRRGHAYMLIDQEGTKRVLQRPQSGGCLHCHASIIPTYRRLGLESQGKTLADAQGFEWPAVMAGFEKMSTLTYVQAHGELVRTPDGPPSPARAALFAQTAPPKPAGGPQPTTQEALKAQKGQEHAVSCLDCHDPQTMQLRITRPGFIRGIAALAASSDPTPHLPSIERWRKGNRAESYDPNRDASRQEMRSFVCAQCHVEYYCGPKTPVFFPWNDGIKVEQIEAYYDRFKFSDGTPFSDFKHAETGAPVYKAQHPEFEIWSQGIHARAGVACADCHMPYKREGAMKVTDHWVRSPLLVGEFDMVNRSCQPCHASSEQELVSRAQLIQDRTYQLMDRSGKALVAMLDAIKSAKSAGASETQLAPIYQLQRKAQWRLDFVNAENSMGFHAPQEVARILGESIDYARQGQLAAWNLGRAPTTRPTTR